MQIFYDAKLLGLSIHIFNQMKYMIYQIIKLIAINHIYKYLQGKASKLR